MPPNFSLVFWVFETDPSHREQSARTFSTFMFFAGIGLEQDAPLSLTGPRQ